MNTYRVYVLNTTQELAPVARVAYVRSDKYAGAWQTARAALNGDPKAIMFNDAAAAEKATFQKDCVVAKIVDIKPRNVKLDKAAIQAILADPKAKPEDKLLALQALV